MMLQLNPPLFLRTEKGPGLAHFLIDYGLEHDFYWMCFLDSGEIWTFRNSKVRAEPNWTLGRQPEVVEEMIKKKKDALSK